MLRITSLVLFLLTIPGIYASWRQDHAVTGLPTLEEPDLTSYAGLVTVRKDHINNIEVLTIRRSITS